MDTFSFQEALSRRLFRWGMANAIGGALLLSARKPFRCAFGLQALSWGAIDAGIALFARHYQQNTAQSGLLSHLQNRNWLRQLLLINVFLDVLYVTVGIAIAKSEDDFRKGTGAGITVQGGFLFFFDLIHALLLGRE